MNDTAAPAPTRRRRIRHEKPPEAAAQPAAPADEAARALDRPPIRGDIRGGTRPMASAEAAAQRAKEILEGGSLGDINDTDEFRIESKAIPEGWTYEWKRDTVLGQKDPAYEVQLARMGWTAVPAKRHPEMMPLGYTGDTITRKGQILMERPKEITDMIQSRDKRAARDQIRVKEQQLSSAKEGTMPRAGDADGDPRTKPNIKHSFEPMPVPEK